MRGNPQVSDPKIDHCGETKPNQPNKAPESTGMKRAQHKCCPDKHTLLKVEAVRNTPTASFPKSLTNPLHEDANSHTPLAGSYKRCPGSGQFKRCPGLNAVHAEPGSGSPSDTLVTGSVVSQTPHPSSYLRLGESSGCDPSAGVNASQTF